MDNQWCILIVLLLCCGGRKKEVCKNPCPPICNPSPKECPSVPCRFCNVTPCRCRRGRFLNACETSELSNCEVTEEPFFPVVNDSTDYLSDSSISSQPVFEETDSDFPSRTQPEELHTSSGEQELRYASWAGPQGYQRNYKNPYKGR